MLVVIINNGNLNPKPFKLSPESTFISENILTIKYRKVVKKFIDVNNIDTMINCATYKVVAKGEVTSAPQININDETLIKINNKNRGVYHFSNKWIYS